MFKNLITLCIIVNSICLALYDYSDRNSLTRYNQILDAIDKSLSIVFIIEACLKIIAMGFIIHRRSYMRDGWNIIDFLISISA